MGKRLCTHLLATKTLVMPIMTRCFVVAFSSMCLTSGSKVNACGQIVLGGGERLSGNWSKGVEYAQIHVEIHAQPISVSHPVIKCMNEKHTYSCVSRSVLPSKPPTLHTVKQLHRS